MSSNIYQEITSDPLVDTFHSITKKYLLFHAAFIALAATELTLVLLFFSSLVDTFILGIAIAVLFFTALLYFILRLYTNDQKPEEFQKLVMSSLSHENKGPLTTAHLAKEIAEKIENRGAPHYPVVEKFFPRFEWLKKLLLSLHHQDICHIKKLCLLSAHEQIRLFVSMEPTNARGHMLLGKNFLDFAHLAERERNGDEYRRAIQGAIEEFTIVDAYQPGNIETHRELAFCYRALKKTIQEIEEFEKIVALEPSRTGDSQALFTLGALYFRTGEKAKGLKVYEKLRSELPEKAAELMQYY